MNKRPLLVIAISVLLTKISLGISFAEEPGLIGCSDRVCEWALITSKKLVKQEKGVELYDAEIRTGHSFHITGYIPTEENQHEAIKHIVIKWNKALSENVSVFCYGRLPVFEAENVYYVLPFDSFPAAFHRAMSEFVHICYNAPWKAWQDGAFLEKHQLTMPLVNSVSVSKPSELFKYVK